MSALDEAALSRRSVLLGAAVTVAAAVAGVVVARTAWNRPVATGGANGYGAPAAPSGVALAPLSSVPAGGGIVLASKGVVLTRSAGGALHGFSSICTHQGCTLAAVARGTIDCPCHGSRFDALTGAVVHGPATQPLPVVPVVVRAGEVYRG